MYDDAGHIEHELLHRACEQIAEKLKETGETLESAGLQELIPTNCADFKGEQ